MYQYGKRVHRQRNYIIFLVTVIIVGIVTVVTWFIIHKDLGSSNSATTAAPIVTEVKGESTQKFHTDEKYFSMDLPSDWKLTKKQFDNVIVYIYNSSKKGGDDRELQIYVDTPQPSTAVTRLMPVTANNEKLLSGNISEPCVNFSGNEKRKGNEPFPAKWQNVNFLCDPITIAQTVGTGSQDGVNTVKVKGAGGATHSYFFVYVDHNIHPDDVIFRDAVSSFKAK